jgi:rare lipoprotein A
MSRGLYRQQAFRLLLVTSAAALTSACSSDAPMRKYAGVTRPVFSERDYGVRSSPRVTTGYIPKGGGQFKLGAPYKVAGRWYVPHMDPNYQEYGVASWYGADFHGRRTANGEVFDANALTAAHPTMPLPCYAYVTNLDNGRTVLVRVNDRGPYVNDRIIDLSYAAAKLLGYKSKGKARVHVQYAGLAPLNGDDSRERQFLAMQPWSGNTRLARASDRSFGPTEHRVAQLPPDASDRWSPESYRTAFDGRMSLAGPLPSGSDEAERTYVQVGLFRDRSNAERLRHDLSSLGPIEVAPIQVGDGDQVFRVRVGPFSNDAAKRAQTQIAAYGVTDSAIVTD